MCRRKDERPDRCPCSYGEKRSAVRRPAYHAKKAAKLTSPPEPPAAPVVPVMAGTDLESDVVRQEIASITQAIDEVRSGGDVAAIASAHGIDGVTTAIALDEHLTRKAGALVASRAEAVAGFTADDVLDDWRERVDTLRTDMLNATRFEDLEAEHGVPDLREQLWDAHRALERARDERRSADEIAELETEFDEAAARLDSTLDALRTIDPEFISPSGVEELYHNTTLGADPETSGKLGALADAYRTVLAEQRPLGGDLAVLTQDERARSLVEAASAVYPSEWIEASNAAGQVRAVYQADKAGHYSQGVAAGTVVEHKVQTTEVVPAGEFPDWGMPDKGVYLSLEDAERDYRQVATREDGSKEYAVTHYEVAAGSKEPDGGGWRRVRYSEHGRTQTGWRRPKVETQPVERDLPAVLSLSTAQAPIGPEGARTAMHELGHRFEDTLPGLSALGQEFLTRRTTNPDGTRQTPVPLAGEGDGALTRPDSFADVYVGRVYANGRFTEVFTTGVEALFTGSHGGLLGVGSGVSAPDPDHRSFVLGALATVRP